VDRGFKDYWIYGFGLEGLRVKGLGVRV